jgi:hypothetical protein
MKKLPDTSQMQQNPLEPRNIIPFQPKVVPIDLKQRDKEKARTILLGIKLMMSQWPD